MFQGSVGISLEYIFRRDSRLQKKSQKSHHSAGNSMGIPTWMSQEVSKCLGNGL